MIDEHNSDAQDSESPAVDPPVQGTRAFSVATQSEEQPPTDGRTTGEHFFDVANTSVPAVPGLTIPTLTDADFADADVAATDLTIPDLSVPEDAHVIVEDLRSQIKILDLEVVRYRELLEERRVRRADELANLSNAHAEQINEIHRDVPDTLLPSRLTELETRVEFLDLEVARYRDLLKDERVRHTAELADVTLAHEHRINEIYGAEPDALVAGRLADLQSQIDFLDLEVARYRDLLEAERVRHATEMADAALAHDRAIDEIHRDDRRQVQALHESYREMLSARQVVFEDNLSRSTAEHAAELDAQRERFEERLSHERGRIASQISSAQTRSTDEANERHHQERQSLLSELKQAKATLRELQEQLHDAAGHAHEAKDKAIARQRELEQDLQLAESALRDAQARSSELEKQNAQTARRLEAERARSAATLSELLERSASLAAESDQDRVNFAAQLAQVEHASAAKATASEREFTKLVAQADERVNLALRREAELEAVITDLRSRLAH